MTAFQRPGVYVQETLNPVQPVVGPNSDSIAAFVGQSDRGPVVPTLISSWSQYTKYYGTWNSTTSDDLPLALFMYFANGGNRAWVNRVLGAGAAPAQTTLYDRAGSPQGTVQLNAINPGLWGNTANGGLNVTVVNSRTNGYVDIVVYFNGISDGNVVERFTDVTMDSTDTRYLVNVINASSNWLTATDLGSSSTGVTKNPAAVTNALFTTGSNGATIGTNDYDSTVRAFDIVKQSLVLNVAGVIDAGIINNAIDYAENRGDVFIVIDGADAAVGSESNPAPGTQLNAANSYTSSSYAAIYYPRLTISDPTLGLGAAPGSTRLVGPGGAVVGLYAATDASRGVFKAPAGLTTRVAGAVAVKPLTNDELDILNTNAAAVNAIKYVSGAGIVVMGSRTLKTGYIDKYVPVRRSLIYLSKAFKDITEFALFEPNDERLWRRVDASLTSFLREFWGQGGLRGVTPKDAFFVKCDAENNPQYLIDNGELHIEVGVALQRPTEFVIIKIGQFDGGTTVTVA